MKKVYLFNGEGTDLYKIGITQNINERVKGVQTGCPHKIIVIHTFVTNFGEKLERTVQRHFYFNKTQGEWFRLNEEEVKTFLTVCQKVENNLKVLRDSGNKFI